MTSYPEVTFNADSDDVVQKSASRTSVEEWVGDLLEARLRIVPDLPTILALGEIGKFPGDFEHCRSSEPGETVGAPPF